MSLSFIVVGSIPAQYFNRRRGLANGIVFACGGLGGAVTSFLLDALINRLDTAWAFRVLGFITLATGFPAAWFIRDRVPPNRKIFIEWELFRDFRFVVLFVSLACGIIQSQKLRDRSILIVSQLAGAVATFPLLVPPFFLPLYATSIGLPSSTAAALVAGFNLSSAVGRIGSGFLSDRLGPLNTLASALTLNGMSMLALWPVSTKFSSLVAFCIINGKWSRDGRISKGLNRLTRYGAGAAAGPFFSLMPTVAGQVFGSARVSIALGMLVTGWGGGYLMVSLV